MYGCGEPLSEEAAESHMQEVVGLFMRAYRPKPDSFCAVWADAIASKARSYTKCVCTTKLWELACSRWARLGFKA